MASTPGRTQYRIREKQLSIGDDFWIETSSRERAFKVDAKTFRRRRTFVLEAPSGEEVYTMRENVPGARDAMEISRGGRNVATVEKHVGVHDRYSIEVVDADDLTVEGSLLDTELRFARDDDPVAQVSNHWLRVRHTFDVEIAPDQDDALILAAIVCIDWMGRG